MLHSLVYISTSVRLLSNESLSSLAEQSSSRNVPLCVTGLLLYSDGNFMQCLEGPKDAVDSLMESITSDVRHFGLVVLKAGDIENREFPDWGMAARSPDAGLTTMAHAQRIDVWLNTSIEGQKSFARVLLGNFWKGVGRDKFNHRLQ